MFLADQAASFGRPFTRSKNAAASDWACLFKAAAAETFRRKRTPARLSPAAWSSTAVERKASTLPGEIDHGRSWLKTTSSPSAEVVLHPSAVWTPSSAKMQV
jgi:hypothetical protein